MIDTERIEALAKAIHNTAVEELVVVDNEFEVRITRLIDRLTPQASVVEESSLEEARAAVDHYVVARRVGIFRTKKPYSPGDRINVGDIVGQIEAMRILNEVVAEQSGVVSQVLVEDGSPVEYGQELIVLKEAPGDETIG